MGIETRHTIGKTVLLVILLLGMTGVVFSQPGKAPVKTIDGNQFYIHTVEEGQTLFRIYKIYGVKVEVLERYNPGAKDGLSLGEKVIVPIEKKEETKKTKTEYTAHTVQKKETVYGISKKYKTTEKELIRLNPGIENGLSEGKVLVVPIVIVSDTAPIPEPEVTLPSDPEPEFVPAKDDGKEKVYSDSIVYHAVKKKETLYSLSMQYGVSIDSIQAANEGLKKGLKKGDTILIPLKKIRVGDIYEKEVPEEDTVVSEVLEIEFKDVYEVILFAPFMLDNVDLLPNPNRPHDRIELNKVTEYSVDFYHGVRLALDSLKQAGLSVNLRVFDTKRDTSVIKSLLIKPDLKNADLILGPFDKKCVKYVSSFARNNKIHMVCPVPYSNKLLFNNPYVSKVIPSVTSKLTGLCNYIATKSDDTTHFILVNSGIARDKYAFQLVADTLAKRLTEYDDSAKEIKTVNVTSKSIKELTNSLKKEGRNIIIVPSSDLGFVSNFLMNIGDQEYEEYGIEVYGQEKWIGFDDIDVLYKHRTNLHVVASNLIDYDTLQTTNLIRAYRNKFHTDPARFGFMGFDVGFNYLLAITHLGNSFATNVDKLKTSGVHTRFNMVKMGEGSGYENINYYILKYENFELIQKN